MTTQLITANDLMIGDYITLKDSLETDDSPLIFRVVCPGYDGENGALVLLKGEKACDEVGIDEEWCGIPLTKEILIKNGWLEESDYENDLYGGHFPEDKKLRLELNVDGNEVWWTINNVEYYIIPLHYVHDLQHALKLCGIDKTIKL